MGKVKRIAAFSQNFMLSEFGCDVIGPVNMVVATVEDANRCVLEIGKFSGPLQDILAFVLKDLTCLKTDFKRENEARKAELAEKLKEMEDKLEQDGDRLKEIVKRKVVSTINLLAANFYSKCSTILD